MYKYIGLIVLFPSLCLAQNANIFKDYGKTNKDNVVVIENQEIIFDDSGIRVVGIAANLLGADYYYRLDNCNQNNLYSQPQFGYGLEQYRNLQNNFNYGLNCQQNQYRNQQYGQYGQSNQGTYGQGQYQGQYNQNQGQYNQSQPAINSDLLKYAIDKFVDKFTEQVTKDCFGLKPGVNPNPNPAPNPNPIPGPIPGPDPNPVPAPSNLDTEAAKIFSTSCIGCHGLDKPLKGLSLAVKDGKLANFTLLQYTEIVDRVTGGGGVQPNEIMPKDGPRLTDEEVETLRKWVREKKKNFR